MAKAKSRKKPTRREVRTIPIYGSPTKIGLYGEEDLAYGRPNPLLRRTQYTGEVAPRTQNVRGTTYHFYRRVTLRGTVKKIINQLRRQGYKAKNFQVKRHIGRRALVVDNVIYTRPEHPNASRSR